MGNTDHQRASLLSYQTALLNRDVGVGFWNKVDAERQASAEERRTGRSHALHMQLTHGQTHALWFVRVVQQEVA